MSVQHKNLANGSWNEISLVEQLANVGSEVERAINWKEKGNEDYSRKAYERALELLALTKNSCQKLSQLKEVTRTYELLVDYFDGDNQFKSTKEGWRKYFGQFTYLAAVKRSS